jgi:hypothetical protein
VAFTQLIACRVQLGKTLLGQCALSPDGGSSEFGVALGRFRFSHADVRRAALQSLPFQIFGYRSGGAVFSFATFLPASSPLF